MSEALVEAHNGVELDSGIRVLNQELDNHFATRSLPAHGLVLAYNFPPFSDASAATVAKRIRQLGRAVDVVSQDMSAIRRVDPDLTDLVNDFVDQHFVLKGQAGFAAWLFIRNYVIDGYAAVKPSIVAKKYGFIYSRSMFPATHFLAAFIKSRHPNLFWISEFSDPVRHDVEGGTRSSQAIPDDYVSKSLKSGMTGVISSLLRDDQSVFAWCEALGVAVSDRVVFTNEHQKRVMLEPYINYIPSGRLDQKAIVSPHPTLGSQFYEEPSANVETGADLVQIGYFGEFYPNRGVSELVRAVSRLEPTVRTRFRVHVFTGDVSKALESLKKFELDTSFVRVKSSKDLFSFLKLASAMDVLYVSDVSIGLGFTENPYLPSKVSDYKGTNVPIIASVWPGSILSKDKTIKKFLLGDDKSLMAYLNSLISGE